MRMNKKLVLYMTKRKLTVWIQS